MTCDEFEKTADEAISAIQSKEYDNARRLMAEMKEHNDEHAKGLHEEAKDE
jgi:hypothetical protein